MDRRSFMKLSPAFPVAAVSASLVLREQGKEPLELDVAVLKLQPGDTIVVSSRDYISQELAERIRAFVEHRLPGVQAIVFDAGLKIEGVLRNG